MSRAQWLDAYEYMQLKGPLTSLKAQTKLGIISFPKRICEMESRGIKINRKWALVKARNGEYKRVREYSLAKEN